MFKKNTKSLILLITLLFVLVMILELKIAYAKDNLFLSGTVTHFTQQKATTEILNILQQGGFNSIREDIYWHVVEREKGKYEMPQRWADYINNASEMGINPILVLCCSNPIYDNGNMIRSEEGIEAYIKYCEFVVSYFKGKVFLYEIWNEWDGGMRRNDHKRMPPDSYLKVLKGVYPRIKAIDPSIIVLNAGVTGWGMETGWMEELAKMGAFNYLDGVAFHPYNYRKWTVEKGMDNPESWLAWIQNLQMKIRKYNDGKPVPFYITEMGFPTFINSDSPHRGYSAWDASLQYARSALVIRTLPYVKGVWWYHLHDGGWNYSDFLENFGLLRPDLTPKESFFTLKDVLTLTGDADFLSRVNSSDPNIWILKFRCSDDKYLLAIWSTHADHDCQIVLQNNNKKLQPVEICKVGRGKIKRTWGKRDWTKKLYELQPKKDNQIDITVRGMPWLILGDLSDVSVREIIKRKHPGSGRDLN